MPRACGSWAYIRQIPCGQGITIKCTTFTPQIKGKPVHLYYWFRKVNEIYALFLVKEVRISY